MLLRCSRASWGVTSSRCYHYSTPDLGPRNSVTVSNPVIKVVRLLHLKQLTTLIGFGLHCNVKDRNAMDQLYFCRVKVNNYPLTPAGRDNHMIEVGDFFSLDSPVYDMINGIRYSTRCAEVIKIEKRDKSKEPPRVLKPGVRQLILRQSEKWRFLVTLSITVTSRRFYRHIMHSDIPKKGHAAFELLLSLCAPKRGEELRSHIRDGKFDEDPANFEKYRL